MENKVFCFVVYLDSNTKAIIPKRSLVIDRPMTVVAEGSYNEMSVLRDSTKFCIAPLPDDYEKYMNADLTEQVSNITSWNT